MFNGDNFFILFIDLSFISFAFFFFFESQANPKVRGDGIAYWLRVNIAKKRKKKKKPTIGTANKIVVTSEECGGRGAI